MFGCFRLEETREKDNATGLKEGGGIEMSIYSAFHIRDARSLSLLNYLPGIIEQITKELDSNSMSFSNSSTFFGVFPLYF